ncbi:proteasome stabiliser-domain-containing protein [Gigaspora rosea]|uniref:Proteasome stabiliser-domain-containing protein n=1 Tax=Gigaspora rosea TaxID=44941 RepID=A0A397UUX5_9GLOM|nr:proteasome stabiliser-domain-containing protein [Gigaspora rosea]
MANNEIQLLEKIELQFCLAENEVQFEKKLEIFLSPVLKKLASPHEIVRKKVIEILNHIKKRITNTVKLPWNSLIEIVYSDNFMNSTLVKNFTIVYLKTAYDRLTEKFLQKSSLKLSDLETKELYVNVRQLIYRLTLYNIGQKETLRQSQSLKSKIMYYLCKSKLAANIFPEMLHVSFDSLFSPKTEINLQKQGTEFIQWIARMVDTSRLELIGRVLLFGLLKIIKETKIEKFNNLMTEQEINQTLLFSPFYGSLDLPIHNPEEDEILKVIIIRFQEINQLDQFDQWTNEENVQAIINILEENIDEPFPICSYLK